MFWAEIILDKSWNHPLGGLTDSQRLSMVLKSSQGVVPAGNLLPRVLTTCGFPHLLKFILSGYSTRTRPDSRHLYVLKLPCGTLFPKMFYGQMNSSCHGTCAEGLALTLVLVSFCCLFAVLVMGPREVLYRWYGPLALWCPFKVNSLPYIVLLYYYSFIWTKFMPWILNREVPVY